MVCLDGIRGRVVLEMRCMAFMAGIICGCSRGDGVGAFYSDLMDGSCVGFCLFCLFGHLFMEFRTDFD